MEESTVDSLFVLSIVVSHVSLCSTFLDGLLASCFFSGPLSLLFHLSAALFPPPANSPASLLRPPFAPFNTHLQHSWRCRDTVWKLKKLYR
jgi:hypothetical protein